ncbi:uncharacterized protein [Triticum aestivum]|uniref:uncharacterized protein isoform X2 n=1 Tax=Triticum aestivum TaxID=4565 RepID=UPI001D013104|nr:uncharacterized protein LOC123125604 isoform X2 [Triticum aestivum]
MVHGSGLVPQPKLSPQNGNISASTDPENKGAPPSVLQTISYICRYALCFINFVKSLNSTWIAIIVFGDSFFWTMQGRCSTDFITIGFGDHYSVINDFRYGANFKFALGPRISGDGPE